jgi:hypothetical protein
MTLLLKLFVNIEGAFGLKKIEIPACCILDEKKRNLSLNLFIILESYSYKNKVVIRLTVHF